MTSVACNMPARTTPIGYVQSLNSPGFRSMPTVFDGFEKSVTGCPVAVSTTRYGVPRSNHPRTRASAAVMSASAGTV